MAAEHPHEFAVAPPGKSLAVFLVVLGLLPVLFAAFIALGDPGAARGALLAWPVLLVVALALFVSTRRRAVAIEAGMLVIRAAVYTQRVPLAAIDRAGARIVNLAERVDLKPRLKTNGFALPGFSAGHFRAGLRGPRLFVLLTDRDRVLALPESDGRVLLLSLQRPQALLDALQATPTASH